LATGVVQGRQRLDEALVARELVETRSRARALILAGDVRVNGLPALEAGKAVGDSDTIGLRATPRFASRGGDKLAFALEQFKIDPSGMTVADIGASTGGFTDCLLQGGAARVYAVDVGYGQLSERLRLDPRVVVMDRTNARYLEGLPDILDLVTIDVSFISLRHILPVAWQLLGERGLCVPLIKPQFEAEQRDVGKGGVVRDPAIHRRVILETLQVASDEGFAIEGLVRSPVVGPAGNVEFLARLRRGGEPQTLESLVERVMDKGEKQP
jgi:23S rRNA (cytidine1920-2'-O)/16S rRNA (cytidine1409-2'-O)-methyltransferase